MSQAKVSSNPNTPVNFVKALLAPTVQVQVTPVHTRFKDEPILNAVLTGKETLKSGSRGQAVEKIQATLNDMGFYSGDQNDGVFGFQTSTAVKNFQSHCKLPQTGVMDQKTFAQLNKLAPAPGQKLWQSPNKDQLVPSNNLGKLGSARAVIDLSEHRLFLYDDSNKVKKVYGIAAGDPNHPDGRGQKTSTGVRKVFEKINDPSPYAMAAWPETRGRAFGTRLLDLHAQNPQTGKWKDTTEELHGTYVRSSIGTDASHGCMRMQNEDIEEVFKSFKNNDLVKIQD